MINAGDLDRQVQFLRAASVDDGLQILKGDFADLGAPVWASRKDVSDGEVQRMGQEVGLLVSRFVVRRSSFADAITAADCLRCEGVTYEIAGIKQVHGRSGLEITARAKVA